MKNILFCILAVLGIAFVIWVIVLNSGSDEGNYSIREQNGEKIYTIEDVSVKESKSNDAVLFNLFIGH